MRERDGGGVADVESVGSGYDLAFDRWVEDADKGALGIGAGDDSLILLADVAGEGHGGDTLLHGAFDLAGSGVALVEVQGDRGELVVGVGGWLAGEHGLEDALGHEVGEAPVGRGGVGVVERGEAEVAGLIVGAAGGEDVLARTHELDDGEREIRVVDGVDCALRLEEAVEGEGVGLWRELGAFSGDESDDAVPTLGRTHHAADGGASGVAEGRGHGLVGGDHKVSDEGGGAIFKDGLDGLHFAVDDHGIGLGAVEVEGAHGDALGVEALRGGVLKAEVGGEGGILRKTGLGASVGAGFVLKPRTGGGVGELGMVADEGGVDGLVGWEAGGADGKLDDDGGTVLILIEAGEVGGELGGEHGEVMDGGVDGLGLGGGGEVERGVLEDGGGDVGDGDQDADAGGGVFGVFDLVEIARGVVIDGGPEELTEVFEACGWVREGVADLGELVGGSGRFAGIFDEDVEAFVDHLCPGGGGQVKGMGGRSVGRHRFEANILA